MIKVELYDQEKFDANDLSHCLTNCLFAQNYV